MKKIATIAILLLAIGIVTAWAAGQQEATSAAAAPTWPDKPITVIVPFNAGGDTDFYARTYAKYLKDIVGQPIVVTNMAGANGSAGTIKVKDSKADGYTALFFHDSMLVNKVVGITDFAHEALDVCAAAIYDNTYIIAVNAKSPYLTFQDLIDAAKANPGNILFGTQLGGSTYYGGVMIEELSGASFNKVDAGGGTERNAALLAGKIDVNFNPLGVMKPYIDSGDFRVLAVFSAERSKLFPTIPTAKEQGYGIVLNRAYFLSFPKGTDPAIVKTMADAMGKVSSMPEYAADIAKAYNTEPAFGNTKSTLDYLDKALVGYMAKQKLLKGN